MTRISQFSPPPRLVAGLALLFVLGAGLSAPAQAQITNIYLTDGGPGGGSATYNLSPSFSAGTTTYTAQVPSSNTQIGLRATINNGAWSTNFGGRSLTTFGTSSSHPVVPKATVPDGTTFIVRYFPGNGTHVDYTITVIPPPAPPAFAFLSSSNGSVIPLSPSFSPTTLTYDLELPARTNIIVRVGGLNGGTWSTDLGGEDIAVLRTEAYRTFRRNSLEDTTYQITLRPEGGVAINYAIIVTTVDDLPQLRNLWVVQGEGDQQRPTPLTPAFDPNVTAYTVQVTFDTFVVAAEHPRPAPLLGRWSTNLPDQTGNPRSLTSRMTSTGIAVRKDSITSGASYTIRAWAGDLDSAAYQDYMLTINLAQGSPGSQGGPPQGQGSPGTSENQMLDLASLIAQMIEWRNDPNWMHSKSHTDRWDRALLAFGEPVSDASLTPMTAAEAQGFADRGWARWVQVAEALQALESGDEEDPPQQQHATPQAQYAEIIAQMTEWRNDPNWMHSKSHTDRWDRALLAFGEPVSDASLTPMTATEVQGFADRGWARWVRVAEALQAVVTGSSSADTLRGTDGDDLLVGLGGADTLSGQGGNDELRGGDGSDTYTGGAGQDRFVFFSGETGANTLTDFASGDVIVLTGDGWPSVADIIASVQAVGAGGYRYALAQGLTVETTNNRSLRTEDFVLD